MLGNFLQYKVQYFSKNEAVSHSYLRKTSPDLRKALIIIVIDLS